MLELLRIKKVYIWEFAEEGNSIGSGRIVVWFWVSPYKAHELATEYAKANSRSVVNFQRIY